MRIFNKLIFVVLLPFLFAACQYYKKVPYLQDTEVVNQIEQKEKLYDAKNREELCDVLKSMGGV